MLPFTTLNAIAAALPIENVDTDMIIPKQFLKTIKRTGLKEGLFYEMRFDVNGRPKEGFVLDREPYTHAQILISGKNFGCGSSREHAPWALLDFGIRCVIASSFADIFYNNCFKNGILPITLTEDAVAALMQTALAGQKLLVDLPAQTITAVNHSFSFELDPFRKHCLLNGLDDIGLTLQKLDSIAAFETQQRIQTPWLYAS